MPCGKMCLEMSACFMIYGSCEFSGVSAILYMFSKRIPVASRGCMSNTHQYTHAHTASRSQPIPYTATTPTDFFPSLQVPGEFEGNSMMPLNQFYLKFLGM